MIQVKEDRDLFLSQFERLEKTVGGQAWLRPIRKAAISRFVDLGFPSTRHEEWRFTNVAPIAKGAFEPANTERADVRPEQIEALSFGDANAALLVFVNGRYVSELSRTDSVPDGVQICSLGAALEAGGQVVQRHLARYADYDDQAFTALNTALMEDGAFVHIPRGTIVEAPIHLLFVAATNGKKLASHPRNLIVVDANSQVTIVESYVGLSDDEYFTNTVTEVVAGENAVVDHYKIERESDEAFHIATLHLHQHRSSNVTSHTVSIGGALVRNNINTVLDGEGCECTLNGLYTVTGTQHVDNHLNVDHAKPHCNSREFFKGICDGKGRGIFSGRIIVRKDAQKTDAKQSNMSLLLSKDAQVESKPQLEIFADDVKCTHGATIGQVNGDAIFYLRTRGISESAARNLLVYAFAREILDRIRIETLRAQLEGLLVARLPQGQLAWEAV